MTRDDVLKEFSRPYQSHEDVGGPDADAMADEIVRLREENQTLHSRILSGNLEDRSAVHQLRDINLRHQEVNDRLRRILAALRNPSDLMVDALREQIYNLSCFDEALKAIRVAVAAAEQEVSNDR